MPFSRKMLRRLQVAVDDAVIVQVADGPGQAEEPFAGQLRAAAPAGAAVSTALSGSPATYSMTTQWSPWASVLQVVEVDQVGVLEVQALGHAAQLDLGVAADQLEGHFLAAVADGEVDLAEAAAADAALERVAVQGPLSGTVGELHKLPPSAMLNS